MLTSIQLAGFHSRLMRREKTKWQKVNKNEDSFISPQSGKKSKRYWEEQKAPKKKKAKMK